MRKYTVLYDSDMGYWGVKSGIRFKSVKDVVYK